MRVLKLLVLFVACGMFATSVFAQDKSKQEDEVFFVVEDMPEYPGGEEALRKDIAGLVKYPEDAHKKGIQGKVYITFIVNENGKIEDTKIARGVDPSLDKEALRVMNALDKTWKPGKQKGGPVKVSYTVPIKFALNDNDKEEKKISKGEGENAVFFIVEEMPEFPGGDEELRKYIAATVKYPEDAVKRKVQGKVYVSFVVEKDGYVGEAKIARGVDPSLDKEALRVINSLPKWKPGKQRGKEVRVAYTVPISFALN